MTTGFALLVGVLPPEIILLLIFVAGGRKKEIGGDFVFVFLVLSLIPLSGFGVPFAWSTHWAFGLFYALVIYLFLGMYILNNFTTYEFPGWAALTNLGLILLCLAISVPVSIIPFYRSGQIPVQKPEAKVTQAIDTFAIKEKFAELENILSREGKKIGEALGNVTKELDAQNTQLKKLRDEKIALEKEVETYKTLAQLTEEQVRAVTEMLNKGKNFDYLIGLLLGIIGSLLVAFGLRFFPKKPEQETQPPT